MMTDNTPTVTLADVMDAIKRLEAGLERLERKVDDFRSSYDHHAAQEARVHSEIREDIGNSRVALAGAIAEANEGIRGMRKDLTRVDTRVGILESA